MHSIAKKARDECFGNIPKGDEMASIESETVDKHDDG